MNETETTTTVQTAPAIIPGTALAPLPEMTTELVAYEQADDTNKSKLENIIAEIDMTDR